MAVVETAESGCDNSLPTSPRLAALAQLTRGQRAVVVVRYFDDLTEAQTADARGCSVGTVKGQTSRAMTALRSSRMLAPVQEETP